MATIRVSYSEISTYRQCPLKWHLSYQIGLRGPDRIPKLDLGTAWHTLLERYYSAQIAPTKGDPADAVRGLDPVEALVVARDTITNIREIHPEHTYQLNSKAEGASGSIEEHLEWMFRGYLEANAAEDEQYEVLTTEYHVDVPLLRYGDDRIRYHGFVDKIERHRETGRLRAVDYKSAGQKDLSKTGYQDSLLLEDQFPFYHAALVIEGVYPVELAVYDAARTDRLKREMTLGERFTRLRLRRTEAELATIWTELTHTAREVVAARRGLRPIVGSPEAQTCGWKCDFMQVHIAGRRTGDYVEQGRQYGFTTRAERAAAAESPEPELEELPVEAQF